MKNLALNSANFAKKFIFGLCAFALPAFANYNAAEDPLNEGRHRERKKEAVLVPSCGDTAVCSSRLVFLEVYLC